MSIIGYNLYLFWIDKTMADDDLVAQEARNGTDVIFSRRVKQMYLNIDKIFMPFIYSICLPSAIIQKYLRVCFQ